MQVQVFENDSSASPMFTVTNVDALTISKDGTWIGTKSLSNPDGKQTLTYEPSTHRIVVERSGSEE